MSQTVADLMVRVFEEIGVKQIFALIGDSLNPLADAVRRSHIEWIGVRHEEGAALAAAGQAKLTGRLAVCAGTTGPGSTHLVAGLYEASRDHAPVLALSGDMPRKMHGTDYFQTTEPDLLFRDVSLYTETISSPEEAPAVIHQAIAAAYAGRGVAHLTLPQDVIGAKVDGRVSSVATLKPRSEFAASEADVADIARRLDQAGSVVIMCGAGCHGAAEELRALSDRLKAPLIHSVKGKDIMPYDDPHWMGGIGMIGTKADYNAVMHCDLLLMLDTDYPFTEFLPSKGSVIQVDEKSEVLGRRAPTELGVLGSVRPTLKVLLDKVAAKSDAKFALCGDGGFNMLMCEFLTAVHHKLPVKVVVYNNSAFGLITLEAESVGLPPYKQGIDFPNPDFAAFARACGGHGFKAASPGELSAAISEAFNVDGPAIIDCVVAADETPNLPHVNLEMVGHYAMAKIKEAVLAVTRS